MGDDGAAGLRPAAPSNPAIREISKVLEPMLTSMRERDASRSSKSSPDNAVRPTILHGGEDGLGIPADTTRGKQE